MSTLTEIENAVAALPEREQQKLLRHLSAKLQMRSKATNASQRKRWPVPPQVDWAESHAVRRPRSVETRIDAGVVAEALAAVRE